MRKHNRSDPLIFHSYQAYLKATPERIARDLALAADEGWTPGVKLVRGAYLATDERELIHDSKEETDAAYDKIVRSLLRGEYPAQSSGAQELTRRPFPRVHLVLASHNAASVAAALGEYNTRLQQSLPTVASLAFAQLHGMADSVSFALLQQRMPDGGKPKVLKCSTWGSVGECMAYLTRRAVSN
jgi:proline dehydrogenase